MDRRVVRYKVKCGISFGQVWTSVEPCMGYSGFRGRQSMLSGLEACLGSDVVSGVGLGMVSGVG